MSVCCNIPWLRSVHCVDLSGLSCCTSGSNRTPSDDSSTPSKGRVFAVCACAECRWAYDHLSGLNGLTMQVHSATKSRRSGVHLHSFFLLPWHISVLIHSHLLWCCTQPFIQTVTCSLFACDTVQSDRRVLTLPRIPLVPSSRYMNKYPGDGGSKVLWNFGTHGILHGVTSQETPPVRTSALFVMKFQSQLCNLCGFLFSFDSPFRDKTSASAGLAVPVETGDRRVWAGSRSEVSKTLDVVFFWDVAKRRLVYYFRHTLCHFMWRSGRFLVKVSGLRCDEMFRFDGAYDVRCTVSVAVLRNK